MPCAVLNEFVDRMAVGFLGTRSGQGVENCVLGVFQVREPKHCFGFGPFAQFLSMRHTGGLLIRRPPV